MSFDTLAPFYRTLEKVTAGGLMQRCRTAYLAEVADCRRALLLGEGPGRFLVELLRAHPHLEVTCVERSPRMIQQALREMRRRGLDPASITFESVDALRWSPPRARFDLVVTHFFLDCFRRDELERLVAAVAAGATPDARWLLADFRVPENGWRRWRAKMVLALLYAFFRFATGLSAARLTPADALLERAGFRLAGRRLVNFDLIHSDHWQRQT